MGLLDLLGNAAIAGGSMLERENKAKDEAAAKALENEAAMQRQKTLADYQADIAMKKQLLLEQLTEERNAKKQSQYVNDLQTAEESSDDIGKQRRLEAFKKKLGQTDATDEELQAGFEAYDDKPIVVDGKVDKQFADRATDKADDFVTASRRTGNSGLIETALKGRTETRAAQTAADKAAFDERKLEQKDASEMEERKRREEADDRRYDLMGQRIAASGSKADKPERLDEIDKAKLELAQKRVVEAEKAVNAAKRPAEIEAANERLRKAETAYESLVGNLDKSPNQSSGKPTSGTQSAPTFKVTRIK